MRRSSTVVLVSIVALAIASCAKGSPVQPWIEAGETCGGLCGHGGTHVLEQRDGTWVSTGNAPGIGTWIS